MSTTVTQKVTNVYTITSCAATVTDCPARIGSVTTEVRTKTNVYAVANPSVHAGSDSDKTTTIFSTAKHTVTNTMYLSLASASAAVKPNANEEVAVYVTATVVPVGPSASTAPVAPVFPGTNAAVKNNATANGTPAAGCEGSGCTIAASSGVRNGAASAAVVLFGALVALF